LLKFKNMSETHKYDEFAAMKEKIVANNIYSNI